jgi:hypothetical protein
MPTEIAGHGLIMIERTTIYGCLYRLAAGGRSLAETMWHGVNEDITDDAGADYTLAVGFSVATLLASFSDAAVRAHAVNGLNVMVHRTGYTLTPGYLISGRRGE